MTQRLILRPGVGKGSAEIPAWGALMPGRTLRSCWLPAWRGPDAEDLNGRPGITRRQVTSHDGSEPGADDG